MWFFYNCIFTLVYILMLPYFLRRMWRRGGYRRGFLQRLGRYDAATLAALNADAADQPALPDTKRRVWVHAVSVGEVRVALDFMLEFRRLRPELNFILTTTTSTGHSLARNRMDGRDVLLYYPVDFPLVIRRVIRQLRPRALVLVEGEFWPNLLRGLYAENIPVMLINGRVSERSFQGYNRLRRWVAPVLAGMDFCGMQSRVDADRLVRIGARPDCVHVLGSAKYDVAVAAVRECDAGDMRRRLDAAGYGEALRFLMGGSTWPGEELALLEIFNDLRLKDPAARLVLVPRHMERAGAVEGDIRRAGLRAVRWSVLRDSGVAAASGMPAENVLLVDTTGDLPAFYAQADVIFVGKSLCCHGGQNAVEPAAFGKAVVVGPYMENFAGIMDDLLAVEALVQVSDKAGLADIVKKLWHNEHLRGEYGDRARRAILARAGVAATGARRINELLGG